MKKIFSYSFVLLLAAVMNSSCESEEEFKSEQSGQNTTELTLKGYFITDFGDSIVTGKPLILPEKVLQRDTLPAPRNIQVKIENFIHPANKILVHEDPVFIDVVSKSTEDTLVRTGSGEVYDLAPRKLDITHSAPINLELPALIQNKRESIYALSAVQGLPDNEVETIEMDQDGNLWLGHPTGISHIIGDKCFYFGPENGLRIAIINQMECNDRGLWLATNSGLIHYDGNDFKIYDEEAGFPPMMYTAVHSDKEGNIWAGSYYYGIVKITTDSYEHFPFYEEPEFCGIRDISDDKNGLVLSTDNGVMFVDEKENKIMYRKYPTPFWNYAMTTALYSSKGELWFSNWGRQLFKISNDSLWDYSNVFGVRPNVHNIVEDADGSIWCTTRSAGLIHFQDNQTYEIYGPDEGVIEGSSGEILPTESAVYFTTNSNGINYIKKEAFQTYFNDDVNADVDFFKHNIDQFNNVWTTTDNKVLIQRNIDGSKIFDFSMNSGDTGYGDGGIQVGENEYYFGSIDGLIHVKDNKAYLYSQEHGILDNSVERMFYDSKGRLWVSTNHSGIYWIDEKEVHQFSTANGFPFRAGYEFEEDKAGNIWIRSWTTGAVKYSEEGFEFFEVPNGEDNNIVNSMTLDKDQDIWYISESNLYYKTPNKTYELDGKDGLLGGKYIKVMYGAEKIWLITSKGISVIEKVPSGAADIILNDKHFSINNLYSHDGLPNLPSRLDDYGITDEGVFYWGNRAAISTINLNEFSHYYKDLTPTIVDISLKNGLAKTDSSKTPFTNVPTSLILDPENNNINFTLASGEIWNQHKIYYSYKLSGQDEDWSDATSERKVIYKNLPPGEYVFQARAKYENDKWSKEISYPFTITTPWYATAVAKFFYIILFIGFVYLIVQLRTKKLKKQKEHLEWEVEKATHQIREKHNEIQDSIAYAKRIQLAILPSPKMMQKHLPQHYIIYKPKDIVAGDFYWVEEHGDETLFAAADCTGHGVPGALVSVVCHNSLNRAVHEFDLTNPALILDKTRELVIDTFNTNEFQVNDGMDIALCSYNSAENKLKYSGANNSLYIVSEGDLTEVKPTKQPVGRYDNPQPFVEHNVDIKKGDTVFLFSDGFADQFGGEKGKKLKYKNFKSLLLRISSHPFLEQSKILDEYFEQWKGDFEQLDDVCIMAVKF